MGVHVHVDQLEEHTEDLNKYIDQLYYMALATCSGFMWGELNGLNDLMKDMVADLSWPAVKYAKLYNNYYYETETYDTEGFVLKDTGTQTEKECDKIG